MIDYLDFAEISRRMRMLRARKTVKEFAKQYRLSSSDIRNWEAPVKKSHLEFLARVSIACAVSLKWLLFGHTYGGQYFNPRDFDTCHLENETRPAGQPIKISRYRYSYSRSPEAMLA